MEKRQWRYRVFIFSIIVLQFLSFPQIPHQYHPLVETHSAHYKDSLLFPSNCKEIAEQNLFQSVATKFVFIISHEE